MTPIINITYHSHPVEYAVFYKKKIDYVRKLLDPKNNEDSIFGKIVAYWDTLEYTKTGIPHLHSLVWLSDKDKDRASVDQNDIVFATLKNPRNIIDEDLNLLIQKNQIHRWVKWKCNVTKDGKHSDKCLRDFPFKEWVNDFQEYPQSQIYYRRSSEDRYVVPYNPEFLKLMKTSTNVQIVSSENIAVYLSKYITLTQKPVFREDISNKEGTVNKVEIFLKERKVGIIEASMELLTWRSYAVRPCVVNFRLSLPNERFLKLMPFNTIRDKIKEINDNEEVIEDLEDESIQGLLTPNVWENYMARNNELENLTFSEMVMEYKWWSS